MFSESPPPVTVTKLSTKTHSGADNAPLDFSTWFVVPFGKNDVEFGAT